MICCCRTTFGSLWTVSSCARRCLGLRGCGDPACCPRTLGCSGQPLSATRTRKSPSPGPDGQLDAGAGGMLWVPPAGGGVLGRHGEGGRVGAHPAMPLLLSVGVRGEALVVCTAVAVPGSQVGPRQLCPGFRRGILSWEPRGPVCWPLGPCLGSSRSLCDQEAEGCFLLGRSDLPWDSGGAGLPPAIHYDCCYLGNGDLFSLSSW